MKLGHKFNKTIKRLGNKIDRGAYRVGHKVNNVLNKIDSGIGKNDVVIRKAGNTLDKVVSMGGGSIPYVGGIISAASGALHGARKISESAKEISGNARKRVQDLEKFNSRKALQEKLESEISGAFV